jgi:hypothetical protein
VSRARVAEGAGAINARGIQVSLRSGEVERSLGTRTSGNDATAKVGGAGGRGPSAVYLATDIYGFFETLQRCAGRMRRTDRVALALLLLLAGGCGGRVANVPNVAGPVRSLEGDLVPIGELVSCYECEGRTVALLP